MSDEELEYLQIRIPAALKWQVKQLCLDKRVTMADFIKKLLEKEVKKDKK